MSKRVGGLCLVRTGCDDEGDDIERHAEACVWVESVVEDDQ